MGYDKKEADNHKATRQELVNLISANQGMTLKDADRVVRINFNALRELIGQRRTVELRGFGTFIIRVRDARDNARDPRTGKRVSVNRRFGIGFRPGKTIRKMLNPDT